ncbi:hypothetical protein [Priestia megaterium]|nr:hypothetical protein [Priestia megaterium]MDI3091459.1 hypothetical protein [Priestia megaterium]MED3864914.1 hypothetical protein [Priestia megaterium]MED4098452.1 hypothetical protein [Priestia megaterium]MED4145928.1 hypothetical protein [Priestia megaterium]MED4168994.1 hypothetical protein [Priestia megaterium]
MIGGRGEDSCGESRIDETTQERILARKSTEVSSSPDHLSHLFGFRLD